MRLPSLLTIASTLALSFTLAACGDDPSVVGSWREMANAFDDDPSPAAEREHWMFADDGTMAIADGDESYAGTYIFSGDRLRLTVASEGESVESTVVLTDDRLLFGAMTPTGDVDGAVGSWAGEVSFGAERVTLSMDLRADGTGDFARSGDDPIESYTGTWREQGDAVEFSFQPEPEVTYTYQLFRVGEEGLGGPLFERI